jgi:adenylate cyclase
MGVSAKNRYYIKRILPFGIIWLIISWFFLLTEYAILDNQDDAPESAIVITPVIFLFASISVFTIGCLVGVLEVFYINKLFINKNFPKKILGKFCLYAALMFVLIFVFYIIAASIEMQVSVFNIAVWNQYLVFLFSMTLVSTSFQLLFSLLVSLFYFEISENLGQNVLLNFFTGRYHKPTDEHRFFMFVDMKNSTAIAEKLGHKRYFLLLRDYYQIFTDSIISAYGEVYQYVGDEIVITWTTKNGVMNNNSINCFFEMKIVLDSKLEYFLDEYGVDLKFKAALNYGLVTTGEIGALKKDIFFTGDVLNITARILGYTDTYKTDFLVSEFALKHLNLQDSFKVTDKGLQHLKGKEEKVRIFDVQKTTI